MKNILILAEDRQWKADFADRLQRAVDKNSVKRTFVSSRADIISELSSKTYDAVILNSSASIKSLQIIFKYMSSTEYRTLPLFFVSTNFSEFDELLKQSQFTHLHLLAAPVETQFIVKSLLTALFPVKTKGNIDKEVKINLEFLKAFIDSTKFILESFCLLHNVEHQRPIIYDAKTSPTYGIEGLINLKSSFFDGQFIVGLEKETYLAICKNLLGSNDKEITKDNADFAGEIVNMIYGQAKTVLNVTGHNFEKIIPTFEISPPKHVTKNHIVVVPLKTDVGQIDILIEVQKIK